MQFTDAEISKQEDFVDVLRFKRQAAHNELMEAQREYDSIVLKLKKEKSILEHMLGTPFKF